MARDQWRPKEEFTRQPAAGQVLCFVGMPRVTPAFESQISYDLHGGEKSLAASRVVPSGSTEEGWGSWMFEGTGCAGSSLRSVTLRFPRHRDAEFLALSLGTELLLGFCAQELAVEGVSEPGLGLRRCAAPRHAHALPLLCLGHGSVSPAVPGHPAARHLRLVRKGLSVAQTNAQEKHRHVPSGRDLALKIMQAGLPY